MCCTRLAQNTERKISPKIRCLRTIAQLCRAISSQLRHGSTIGKKSLNANISSIMSSQYGELQPTNGWAHFGSLGHRSKFQQVSRLGIVTAATSYQKPSKLCTMFGRLLGWCTIYTLSGTRAPWCKKSPKIRRLGTIAQLCQLYLCNWGTYRQSGKTC